MDLLTLDLVAFIRANKRLFQVAAGCSALLWLAIILHFLPHLFGWQLRPLSLPGPDYALGTLLWHLTGRAPYPGTLPGTTVLVAQVLVAATTAGLLIVLTARLVRWMDQHQADTSAS